MSPSTRILKSNRRERSGRGPDLTAVALRLFLALLALSGLLGKKKAKPQGNERLSELLDGEYRVHLYAEMQRYG